MRRGFLIAFAVILLDQASKFAVLDLMRPPHVIEVLPVFNLVLAMNRGVSFSLFTSHAEFAPYLLSALSLAIVGALAWWMREMRGMLAAAAFGLIAGGALGNVIDRLRVGAVVDFLDLHWGVWHWPAFNLADSAISVGAILLMFDALFSRPHSR
jgi:signal peptidase II